MIAAVSLRSRFINADELIYREALSSQSRQRLGEVLGEVEWLVVDHYLDLLEKVFVIFRVGGFSRNLRKEVTKNSRYYFFDNGVRNSLIQKFNPPKSRQDAGQLWENFLMVERRKTNQTALRSVNTYFWRTYDQKEIDCIEEHGGRLFGYEFKWGKKTIPRKTSSEFLKNYPGSELFTVNPENFENFLR